MNKPSLTDKPQQVTAHGIQCPACQQLIQIPLPTLLSGTVFCSACGLRLTVDQNKSKDGLDLLRSFQQAMQDCENKPGETLPAANIQTQMKGK